MRVVAGVDQVSNAATPEVMDDAAGEPDDAEAVRWYRKGAEQGHARAQAGLGFMYTSGLGVPHDDGEAVQWYRKAAEQGDAVAQASLGFMYRNGRGVPQDDAEAVQWYRKAAEQGHALAQAGLGAMYRDGRGVAQNYVQAHKWFSLAAARFPASETEKRDRAVEERDRIATKMTSTQIAEAQKLAREWKTK